MKVRILALNGNWVDAINTARRTRRLPEISGPIPHEKRRALLLAEHSPIRAITVQWIWTDIPYWVSVQFSRHKIGIEHFVTSQRPDRTGTERADLPQGALVNHECLANYQAIINISRRRLCAKASPETRDAWIAFLKALDALDVALVSVCVPECVYRGFCSELQSCGHFETEYWFKEIVEYRGIKAEE